MSPREELEHAYRTQLKPLLARLRRLFPSLTDHERDDLVQLAFTQALALIAGPDFQPVRSWGGWLSKAVKFRALDYLRKREAISLDALLRNAEGDSDPLVPRAADPRPSELLRQGERTSQRRQLISNVFAAYVAHTEKYKMQKQREVFERSLRGQAPEALAAEMQIKPQQAYDHRARAFEWLHSQVEQRDPRNSVLASIFGGSPSSAGRPLSPERLVELIRWVVEECGALCPSEGRLALYRRQPHDPTLAEVGYHVRCARWYLDLRPQTPGCRLCADGLAPSNLPP